MLTPSVRGSLVLSDPFSGRGNESLNHVPGPCESRQGTFSNPFPLALAWLPCSSCCAPPRPPHCLLPGLGVTLRPWVFAGFPTVCSRPGRVSRQLLRFGPPGRSPKLGDVRVGKTQRHLLGLETSSLIGEQFGIYRKLPRPGTPRFTRDCHGCVSSSFVPGFPTWSLGSAFSSGIPSLPCPQRPVVPARSHLDLALFATPPTTFFFFFREEQSINQ